MGLLLDLDEKFNLRFFKLIFVWGVCFVYCLNYLEVKEGSIFYGFFMIVFYSVRSVEGVD